MPDDWLAWFHEQRMDSRIEELESFCLTDDRICDTCNQCYPVLDYEDLLNEYKYLQDIFKWRVG